MNLQRLTIIVLLLCVCIAIGSTMMSGADSREMISQERGLKDEATPVQLGVMTEKQRTHSKLYKYESGKSILELLNLKDRDIEVRQNLALSFSMPDSVQATDADEVRRITCAADAVVVGKITSQVSQITENQKFIFTDYGFLVQEVLKNGTVGVVQQESEITITRPGGAVLIAGKRITAIDDSVLPLRRGKQYLLFLRYLPETESFRSIDTGESYELAGNDVKALRSTSTDLIAAKHNSNSLLSEIKTAAGGCR